MEVRLLVAKGKNAGQVVKVSAPKFLIGRAEDCHLRPRSDAISRHHCAIFTEEGFVAVRDFGSKNGTFLNDERIRVEAELKNGDRLRVGQLEFDVELATDVGGKKKPKVQSVQEAAVRTAGSAKQVDEDDVDLGDWLGEDVAAPIAETTTIDNTRPDLDQPQSDSKADPSQEKTGETVALKGHTGNDETVKVPGGLSKKPAPANTRDAAGEALKNFFRGR